MMSSAGAIIDGQKRINQNKSLLGSRTSLKDINSVYGSVVLGGKTKFQTPKYTKEQVEQAINKIRIQNKRILIRKFIFYSISIFISALILFKLFFN